MASCSRRCARSGGLPRWRWGRCPVLGSAFSLPDRGRRLGASAVARGPPAGGRLGHWAFHAGRPPEGLGDPEQE
eukprot:7396904-Lingulodinium_polyedra.AAC.1